jgi:integrase/recombinase XerC
MTRTSPAIEPIELDCADQTIGLEMARWQSYLRAERRLSPKTLDAYGRDVRQCLEFLCEHWGVRVTLARFAGLEASDIRAFMAMRRADDIAGRSLMRSLASLPQSALRMPTSGPASNAKGGFLSAMPP